MMYSQNSLNIGKCSPHRIWWEEILQSLAYVPSLATLVHILDTHIQTHNKLLRMSMFPEGISTERDLYSSWHGRSSGLTHRHTHVHAYTHSFLVFIPVGAELSISWADSILFTLSYLFILSPSSAPLPLFPLTLPFLPFPLVLPIGWGNPTLLVTRLKHLKHEKFEH